MKKLILTLAIASITRFSYAQFNTSSGNTTTMDKVGIGTTSPGALLHVSKDGGGGDVELARFEGTNASDHPYLTIGGTPSSSYHSGFIMYNKGTDVMTIDRHGGQAATIGLAVNSGGKVGIGTTAPGYKLDVNGSMNLGNLASGSDAILHFSNNASGGPRSITYRAATAAISIDNTSGSALMTILNGGNVGIGTTAPSQKLDVNGTVVFSPNTSGKNTFTFSTNAVDDARLLMKSVDATKVDIQANGASYFNGGNVGIGTTSPNGVFHIANNVPYGDNSNNQLILTNGGYRNSESGTLQADNAGIAYYFTNYNAGGKHYDRTLDLRVRGASDGTYGAGMIRFFANDYTSGSAEREIMRVHGNGNVLIGKTIQTNLAYKLDIGGKVRANEIVVNSDGADFVFGSDYKLPKLSAVKKFIDQNHHLPEIPSAQEMQKNGMSVGELNTKLLQKVEELTLYLIEQNEAADKQNKLHQERINQLKKELTKLHKAKK